MIFNPFKKQTPLAPRPGKQFTENAKDRFLAAFDAHYGTRPAPRMAHGMAGWAKGLIVAGSLVAVMVSVSAYADNANVAADSPLYPFKRLGENVQLAFTPAAGQAQLEVTLATRRANEIQDLSARKPSSTLIAGLFLDLDNDVSSSLGHVTAPAPSGPIRAGLNAVPRIPSSTASTTTLQIYGSGPVAAPVAPSSTICGQVATLFSDSSAARAQILSNLNLVQRIHARCGQNTNVVATTTAVVIPAHPITPGGPMVPATPTQTSTSVLNVKGKSGIVVP